MDLSMTLAMKAVKSIVHKRARNSHHVRRHSEDLCQEALIYMLGTWKNMDLAPENEGAFVYHLAKWSVANALRNRNMNVIRQKRGEILLTVSTTQIDELGKVDEDRFFKRESKHTEVEDSEDFKRVVAAAKLTEREKFLIDCGGETLEEIASSLGISSQAVHQRVGNTMRKLSEASLKLGVRETELKEVCKPKFQIGVGTLKRMQDLMKGGMKRAAAARAMGVDQTTACRYVDSKGEFRQYYYEQHGGKNGPS